LQSSTASALSLRSPRKNPQHHQRRRRHHVQNHVQCIGPQTVPLRQKRIGALEHSLGPRRSLRRRPKKVRNPPRPQFPNKQQTVADPHPPPHPSRKYPACVKVERRRRKPHRKWGRAYQRRDPQSRAGIFPPALRSNCSAARAAPNHAAPKTAPETPAARSTRSSTPRSSRHLLVRLPHRPTSHSAQMSYNRCESSPL